MIPNAADRTRFKLYDEFVVTACLDKYGLKNKGYCLFVGTIDYPGKNIMSALEAYVSLKRIIEFKRKWSLLVKRDSTLR